MAARSRSRHDPRRASRRSNSIHVCVPRAPRRAHCRLGFAKASLTSLTREPDLAYALTAITRARSSLLLSHAGAVTIISPAMRLRRSRAAVTPGRCSSRVRCATPLRASTSDLLLNARARTRIRTQRARRRRRTHERACIAHLARHRTRHAHSTRGCGAGAFTHTASPHTHGVPAHPRRLRAREAL